MWNALLTEQKWEAAFSASMLGYHRIALLTKFEST
jgi:hypothetical protein